MVPPRFLRGELIHKTSNRKDLCELSPDSPDRVRPLIERIEEETSRVLFSASFPRLTPNLLVGQSRRCIFRRKVLHINDLGRASPISL